MQRGKFVVRGGNQVREQPRQRDAGFVRDTVIPQPNLVLVPNVHGKPARVVVRIGVPALDAEHVGDTEGVHLVGAPVAAKRRENKIIITLVDPKPARHLHDRFHRVFVEVGQALLRADDPRHAVNVDV